jgi:hypothetical protein
VARRRGCCWSKTRPARATPSRTRWTTPSPASSHTGPADADGIGGLALAEEARRRWPGLGVVYVTGRPSGLDGHVLRARDRFLPGPVTPVALVRAVRGLVGTSSRPAP